MSYTATAPFLARSDTSWFMEWRRTVDWGLLAGAFFLMAIGLGLFAYSLFWFINTTGKEVAIGAAVSMIATAQWIVGPYFAYYHDAVTYKYRMYVDEEAYSLFVIPSLILFVRTMAGAPLSSATRATVGISSE